MAITAQMVKELRERTGAGMMECKKALTEAGGEMEVAVEQMRISGLAKADKKSGRTAAEGTVAIQISADKKKAVMLEVNCETDFVGKGDELINFANAAAAAALRDSVDAVEAIADCQLPEHDGKTVEQVRQEMVSRIGENVKLRRMALHTASEGVIGSYSHGSRIGVLVATTGDEALAKDLAMHVAASHPLCISSEDAPAEDVARERAVIEGKASESGKPAEIVEKMIAGGIQKYLKTISLLDQPFVKDPDMSIAKLLKSKNAEVGFFERLEVGEGVEKKVENFAEEVAAQVKSMQ